MSKVGLKQKRVKWLLDSIDGWEAYDLPEPIGAKAKLEFIRDQIINEGVFHYSNLKRFGSYQAALEQQLKGLPGWISIPFSNYKIGLLLKGWGYTWSSEAKEDRAVANYWSSVAALILQQFSKHGISYTK